MKRNSIIIKKHLSPNFSIRKKKIKHIVLHYTGMDKISDTLKLFLDSESKVSCHWLITKKGKLYKIVDEKNVAWHAGLSYWKGEKNINETSIGIELENEGHGKYYSIFSNKQVSTLIILMKRIFLQYNIKKHNVVAHSDIAPKRKLDPGELFDWETLAKKKLAYWPKIKKYKKNKSIYQLGQEHDDILKIKNMLFKIGYDCNNTKLYDLVFKLTIEAFQRRFFPEKVNGIIDTNVYNRIVQIYKNS